MAGSTPGWYPDPAGTPNQYRYWDGTRWSDQTTTDPRQPPPAGPTPAPARRSSSRAGILIIGILVLVTLIVVGVLIFRNAGDPGIAEPMPSSTVSGWNDSSPIDTASPTPSPTPSPTESTFDPNQVSCPSGDPYGTANHPTDNRVHGGQLSFPVVESYEDPASKGALSWFNDVSSQSQTTEPMWESWFAVGEVDAEGAFATAERAAASSMQCVVNEGLFSQFDKRTDIRNEKITIDGHDGWIRTSEIRVDNPSLSVEGDVVTFVFIDDGRGGVLSGYCGIVPIDDQPRLDIAQQVLDGLRVN